MRNIPFTFKCGSGVYENKCYCYCVALLLILSVISLLPAIVTTIKYANTFQSNINISTIILHHTNNNDIVDVIITNSSIANENAHNNSYTFITFDFINQPDCKNNISKKIICHHSTHVCLEYYTLYKKYDYWCNCADRVCSFTLGTDYLIAVLIWWGIVLCMITIMILLIIGGNMCISNHRKNKPSQFFSLAAFTSVLPVLPPSPNCSNSKSKHVVRFNFDDEDDIIPSDRSYSTVTTTHSHSHDTSHSSIIAKKYPNYNTFCL
jgi:hypothetical protein